MGLDAGEVQARLTARDDMSATIVSLTERIKALQVQIEALGSVTGPSLQMLQQNLQGAQMKLAETKLALNEVNSELGETAVKAEVASGKFEQMERLASRMVERLLIFYALKGSFDFVVGLFEADEALVKINQSSDLTLAKLQQLQFMANQTGIPFKSLAADIDQLDKRLSQLKPETVDTLKGLGQDPSKLFQMSSDDRVTAIIESIAALPTQLQRTKAEISLFGNDAIDPLIQKFKELEGAAAAAIRPDSQVQAMAQTVQMYKEFAANLADVAARIIANAQGAVTSLFAPAYMKEGDPGAKKYQDRQMAGIAMMMASGGNPFDALGAFAGGLEKPQMAGGDGNLQIPKSGTGPGGGNVPLMGDAFIASLKAQSLEVNKLSDAQLVQLDRLRAMNQLTADNAARLDVSTTQYREFTKAVAEADADWKKVLADFERFEGENYKLSAAQEAQISIMKLQGRAAREIADETNLPIQAIVKWERQWAMSLRNMEIEGKEFMRQLKENTDVINNSINDYADATGQGPGSSTQRNLTGDPAFDAANQKRNNAVDAAQQRMNRTYTGPNSEQANEENQKAALAQMAKAEAEFIDETTAAARAARDMADSHVKAKATLDMLFPQMQSDRPYYVPSSASLNRAGYIASTGSTSGIPSHKEGGPTDEGLAYLHDSEYVVPKGGALVMGGKGGGDTYHITVPLQGLAVTTDSGGLAIIERTVVKAVDSVMRQGRRFTSA